MIFNSYRYFMATICKRKSFNFPFRLHYLSSYVSQKTSTLALYYKYVFLTRLKMLTVLYELTVSIKHYFPSRFMVSSHLFCIE